ncbi:MAG: hypothetical protein RIR45_1242 [Pseudomonadota bacterium]
MRFAGFLLSSIKRLICLTRIKPMKIAQPPPPNPGADTGLVASAVAKPLRADGVEARNRLLDAALVLFAEKGFANTSTREIALAAQVNIASISYYFGDKAGLYRGVFEDPRSNANPVIAEPGAPLEDILRAILLGYTEPLKQGHVVQSCMRLHFREMLEPTGLWQEEIKHHIQPAHAALVQVLCLHLGLDAADDDVHRLAFSITGLGVMLHVGSEVIPALRPTLTATPQAIDRYADHLVAYAQAMVACEAQRRAKADGSPNSKETPGAAKAKK